MTTLLFLPAAAQGYRWLRIADDGAITEGEGVPASADERIVAVAPSLAA